jgi:hypothetical protein
MAQFVYIDETGSVGTSIQKQPQLILVAAIVDESEVQRLGNEMRLVAEKHLGWPVPHKFEFHGNEIWSGRGAWHGKTPPQLLAAYEDALELLNLCDVQVAHATIDRPKLHQRYNGQADSNAYRLALQFLLEKVDALGPTPKVVVADEKKEEQLHAVQMVADMQQWGAGEVPGRTLRHVIDCLHFVRSEVSPGVQLADLVAFVMHRRRNHRPERHSNAEAVAARMMEVIATRTRTYRQPWP